MKTKGKKIKKAKVETPKKSYYILTLPPAITCTYCNCEVVTTSIHCPNCGKCFICN